MTAVGKSSGNLGQNLAFKQSFCVFLLFLSFTGELQQSISLFFIIEKYIMLDPAAQGKQDCCCSVLPDATRLTTYSQQAHAHTAYIYTTYIHTDSCWHHGCTSPPTCGLAPFAALTLPYTHMHRELL